jgi:hypothetical protein
MSSTKKKGAPPKKAEVASSTIIGAPAKAAGAGEKKEVAASAGAGAGTEVDAASAYLQKAKTKGSKELMTILNAAVLDKPILSPVGLYYNPTTNQQYTYVCAYHDQITDLIKDDRIRIQQLENNIYEDPTTKNKYVKKEYFISTLGGKLFNISELSGLIHVPKRLIAELKQLRRHLIPTKLNMGFEDGRLAGKTIPELDISDNTNFNFVDYANRLRLFSPSWDNISEPEKVLETQVEGSAGIPTTSEKSVISYIDDPSTSADLKHLYNEYAFYNNLLDYFHDFLHVAVRYYNIIVSAFIIKNKGNMDNANFQEHIAKIVNRVITIGSNVNQNECRAVAKEFIDEFSQKASSMGLNWLIPNMDNALVVKSKLDNLEGLRQIFTTLKADIGKREDVLSLYFESSTGDVKLLVEAAHSLGVRIAVEKGAPDLDAGSGISLKTIAEYTSTPNVHLITPIGYNTATLVNSLQTETKNADVNITYSNAPAELGDNLTWHSFGGLQDVRYDLGTKTAHITTHLPGGTNTITVFNQKFAVNKITVAIGAGKLRGTNKEVGDDEKGIAYEGRLTSPIELLMAKSPTDAVQFMFPLGDINFRVAIVCYDVMAVILSMIIGYPACLLITNGELHYLCFDKRARILSPKIVARKLQTLHSIQGNEDMYRYVISMWFNVTKKYFVHIHDNAENPATFLAAVSTLNLLNKRVEIFEGNFKNYVSTSQNEAGKYAYNTVSALPTTIIDFLQYMTGSEELSREFEIVNKSIQDIIKKLSNDETDTNIRRTLKIDPIEMINTISQLKQELFNILKNVTDIDILETIIAAIYAYSLVLQILRNIELQPDAKPGAVNLSAKIEKEKGETTLKISLQSAKDKLDILLKSPVARIGIDITVPQITEIIRIRNHISTFVQIYLNEIISDEDTPFLVVIKSASVPAAASDPAAGSGEGGAAASEPAAGSGSGEGGAAAASAAGSGSGEGGAAASDPAAGSGEGGAAASEPAAGSGSGEGGAAASDPAAGSGEGGADASDPAAGSGEGGAAAGSGSGEGGADAISEETIINMIDHFRRSYELHVGTKTSVYYNLYFNDGNHARIQEILKINPQRFLLSYVGLTLLQNKFPYSYGKKFYRFMNMTDSEYTELIRQPRYVKISQIVNRISSKTGKKVKGGARKTRRRRHRKITIRKNKHYRKRTRKNRF